MSEELQQKLRTQLWTVANNLRGNMSANEFMYFSLGFIFYKYLSEKIEALKNAISNNEPLVDKANDLLSEFNIIVSDCDVIKEKVNNDNLLSEIEPFLFI